MGEVSGGLLVQEYVSCLENRVGKEAQSHHISVVRHCLCLHRQIHTCWDYVYTVFPRESGRWRYTPSIESFCSTSPLESCIPTTTPALRDQPPAVGNVRSLSRSTFSETQHTHPPQMSYVLAIVGIRCSS